MRQIDLGMPTLLQMPAVADCAAYCEQNNLQFVEIGMNLPMYQINTLDIRAIDTACQAHGIYCTLHLEENFNACDYNPLVRDAYLQTMRESIAATRTLGMPIINMHLHDGIHFKLPGKKVWLFAEYEAEYRQALLRLRTICEEAAGGAPLKICVENCDGYLPHAQRGIELLLESELFGLTVDIGHSACAGDMDVPFLQTHANRIRHIHLHDATDKTCHLPLGEGARDIPATLSFAAANGCRAVVEVKSLEGLDSSLTYLANMPALTP